VITLKFDRVSHPVTPEFRVCHILCLKHFTFGAVLRYLEIILCHVHDALKGCYSLYKKSPSRYEILNVVVIQLSNTSNKPHLNVFVANNFGSDRAIVRQLHVNGKNIDSMYNYRADFPLSNKIYIISYTKHILYIYIHWAKAKYYKIVFVKLFEYLLHSYAVRNILVRLYV
jgi:glutathione peroxidase-family protein